jgi:hypothetical protein
MMALPWSSRASTVRGPPGVRGRLRSPWRPARFRAALRPVGTSKKTLHIPAPSASTRRAMAGKDETLSLPTVVFTCSRNPAPAAAAQPSSVHRNEPRTPRRPSWTSAVGPSTENETALAPARRSAASAAGFALGVPAGDTATDNPPRAARATSVTRSGRRNGSPPVKTTRGRGAPRFARSLRTLATSSVDSSKGSRPLTESALQCAHARSHARVSSKSTRNGRTSMSKRSLRTAEEPWGREGLTGLVELPPR